MSEPSNKRDTAAAQWSWAVSLYLTGEPRRAIRTTPIIELLDDLLDILRSEDYNDSEAYAAARRAVRLLNAFVAEADRRPLQRLGHDL
jgi:hypothetical protein